jgi:hypothetical protein
MVEVEGELDEGVLAEERRVAVKEGAACGDGHAR